MTIPVVPMKLLLTYDVKPDQLQEYYQFVLGRYIPVVQQMGLEVSEAWHTGYGDWPNRLIGFVARDKKTMLSVLNNQEWSDLNDQLEEFVTGFRYKIIPYREGFQL
jgi:hypothetical protein